MMHAQRVIGTGPTGTDQHGIPGDCLRAAVASLTGVEYDEVPHFALWPAWWWDLMRVWARDRGQDFACLVPVDGQVRQFIVDNGEWSGLLIGAGPSPRGAFRHVAILDADLNLVHDPHPSGAGLVHVQEVFVLTRPYDTIPVAPLTLTQ